MMLRTLSVASLLLITLALTTATARQDSIQEPEPLAPELVQEFASQGIRMDREAGTIRIDGVICQRTEPLEYLLVKQPQGKDHESLLAVEELSATALNAAMLMMGVVPGENGRIIPTDPEPTLEEVQAGVAPYTFEPAEGDGFYMYVSWEIEVEGELQRYRFRAEDLVLNLREESTYQRGKFVYLGSRFIRPHKDAKEFFAAEGEGNLVSLVNFRPADHLLGGADASADNQSIWFPNVFLLPPVGHPVEIWFTRDLLEPGVQ
ncbi:MAG: YdjY domain-containing protein [Planctomycetota bacterium]